ncbi:Oidioi.mRNA.OKI2018_I69.chr2.g6594.t2.cds [Oikopleura dioica]|uniref:Oidioi.mRNA.OKI2018_I69.chr2.g6594.t2.cds n=1 Tax=Oikopleura dioica TaxID=34765 RepID=A0ABN7T8B4_OIKDI|nr:Oidioi.mRNA.OKI2018_I69.chr2.g6594.t2.cds [Oikopleura dioica]
MEQLMDLGKVSFTSGDYSLTIQNVDDDKQGLWNCQQAGRIVASYNLIVDVPPEIEMVSSSPVEVGEDSTLICQASGRPRPKIYWTRKGGETIDGAKTIELADADGVQRSQGTLVVQNVTKSMIAEISCNAQSRATTATQTTDVNVKSAPVVITEEGLGMTKRRYAKVGSATQVSCIVQGFPIPTVRWWLDERFLRIDEIEDERIKLSIKEVKDADFGVYKCEPSNELGSDHFKAVLARLPKTTNEAQTQARKSGQNGASTQSVNLLTLGFLLAYLLI